MARRVNHIVAKGTILLGQKGQSRVAFPRDALAQYRDTQVRGRDLPYLVVYLFNAPFVRSRMGTIIDTE